MLQWLVWWVCVYGITAAFTPNLPRTHTFPAAVTRMNTGQLGLQVVCEAPPSLGFVDHFTMEVQAPDRHCILQFLSKTPVAVVFEPHCLINSPVGALNASCTAAFAATSGWSRRTDAASDLTAVCAIATSYPSWQSQLNWYSKCQNGDSLSGSGPWDCLALSGNGVGSIDCDQTDLAGPFPSEIAQLTALTYISLMSNDLTGKALGSLPPPVLVSHGLQVLCRRKFPTYLV